MQQNNIGKYIDYFRQLAIKHKNIQHDPTTETGDGDIEKKRFTTWSNEEVLSGLRTKISFPALLIELYENNLSSETVYDIRQRPKGSFTVLEHAATQDLSDQERAYTLAETIVYDLLKQIWQDTYGKDVDRCQTVFKQFRYNINITPTGKLFQNEYGFYVEFDFDFQNDIDIRIAPDPGTFIN